MDSATFISTLVSTFVGGLVTWAVAWIYYRRASAELRVESEHIRRESEHLRWMVNVLSHALENAGWIEVTRNEHGELEGAILRASAHLVGTSTVTASGDVMRPGEAPADG